MDSPARADDPRTIIVEVDEVRRARRAAGGRAKDRIGEGRAYVPHDYVFGAAAARRRRQMAKRGVFGCAACGEPTPAANLYMTTKREAICHECVVAAGVQLPGREVVVEPPHDHDVHIWEGEGGA